jgi:hypothetical protein
MDSARIGRKCYGYVTLEWTEGKLRASTWVAGVLVVIAQGPALTFAADYYVKEVAKTGTIEGVVRFPGETPHPFMIVNASDHDCPHGIGQNHLLVEQTSLALQNAVIVLDAVEGEAAKIGKASVLTRGCRLEPRVQIAAQNTNLLFQNQDGARHRLRASIGGATRFDVDLLVSSASMRRPLVDPGFYRIDCSRHPWERAWIHSSPHPYVALSDAVGHFTIPNVPVGKYRLRAWHEGWAEVKEDDASHPQFRPVEQVLEIVVRSKRVTTVTFDQLRRIPEPD